MSGERASRRDVLAGTAIALSGVAAASAIRARAAVAAQGASDFADHADLLNYVLRYKHICAEFYRQGNDAGLLQGQVADYFKQYGALDQAHVGILTTAVQRIGAQPAAAPAVSFGDAFASADAYVTTAHEIKRSGLEGMVGVTADPLFSEDVAFAGQFTGLLGVEARMVALLGLIAQQSPGTIYDTPAPRSRTKTVQALRRYVTGAEVMAAGAAVTS